MNDFKKQKIILLICNIFLIVVTLAGAVLYARHVRENQEEAKKQDFIKTIESMKQVSQNYFDSERGYVKNWAHYISEHGMSLDEALDFLRDINTNDERFAHIVDMESYEAYSSFYERENEKINTYVQYKDTDTSDPFGTMMRSMYDGSDEDFSVLGKYRLQETQSAGVSIGTRVTLSEGDTKRDYLLLRVIPANVIRMTWVFPLEYSSAEVGIMTRGGDYVIQSPSMKSQNFTEYIRGYNFQDDYNAVFALKEQLLNTDTGNLYYKNFRGERCFWYYSSFGDNSILDILGVIKIDELHSTIDAWYIVFLVCGMLMVLALIDGAYLMMINHRLRETARVAEQASRAKTQFLSAMSHDIRTPLNAVLGMMDLAQKRAEDSEYVKECMDKGLHSGRQLLTLINDVLDISKIESGKFMLNLDTISLEELEHDLTQMLSLSIQKKGIKLESDFDDLPHKYIKADKIRLSQIYVNILTNAVKYTNPGGKITLKLYEKDIKGKPSHTKLIFYVQDTGIGMSEEFQKHMYSNFSREVNTQVNSTQGTGLGLSIVKQMVELMNGTITCYSKSGVGTTFVVSIDFQIVNDYKTEVSNHEYNADIEGMHLLVAEDNDLNWEIAREFFAERKITCDHAENGKECIDKLKAAPAGTYDAILMDVHMPVMNGYEATKAIRRMNDESRSMIPIIAMTADAFAEDVQMCLNCGMNGHIAKPIDMDRLVSYMVKIKNGKL